MTNDEKIRFIEDAILTLMKKSIKLKPSDNLIEMSLDSLEIVELQMYYEEETGHELSPDARVVTVEDLMAIMK
jgi:acyl carrier protein